VITQASNATDHALGLEPDDGLVERNHEHTRTIPIA
jgi:hypothetical protein